MANQDRGWLLAKVVQISMLLFTLVSIFGVIAATDIFFVSKESRLESEIRKQAIFDEEIVRRVIKQEVPDLELDPILAQFGRADIRDKQYLFSSYDFTTGLIPISPTGEALKESLFFTPEEAVALTQLPEENWDYIWSEARGDFPSLLPARLAVSLSAWDPSKLYLFGDIVEEIREQKGEQHTARVIIRNTGNGDSGPVTISFPRGVQPVDEQQKWNILIEERRASVDFLKPGEEVVLLLQSAESFQLGHKDIDLEDKGSYFRERWAFWLGMGIIGFITLVVVILDVMLRSRRSSLTPAKEVPDSER